MTGYEYAQSDSACQEGTFGFAAPEVLDKNLLPVNNPASTRFASDVYSLGVLIAHLEFSKSKPELDLYQKLRNISMLNPYASIDDFSQSTQIQLGSYHALMKEFFEKIYGLKSTNSDLLDPYRFPIPAVRQMYFNAMASLLFDMLQFKASDRVSLTEALCRMQILAKFSMYPTVDNGYWFTYIMEYWISQIDPNSLTCWKANSLTDTEVQDLKKHNPNRSGRDFDKNKTYKDLSELLKTSDAHINAINIKLQENVATYNRSRWLKKRESDSRGSLRKVVHQQHSELLNFSGVEGLNPNPDLTFELGSGSDSGPRVMTFDSITQGVNRKSTSPSEFFDSAAHLEMKKDLPDNGARVAFKSGFLVMNSSGLDTKALSSLKSIANQLNAQMTGDSTNSLPLTRIDKSDETISNGQLALI